MTRSPRVPTSGGTAYRAPLPPRHEVPRKPFPWRTLAVVVVFVDMVVCALLSVHRITSLGTVTIGLFLLPLLMLLSTPLFVRATKYETWDLGGLMALGLALRFLACFYRFDHAADGGVYVAEGARLAQSYRHLDFGVATGGSFPGTGGMRFISGIVAVFTNSNAFAEYLVFTWLAFLGCYLLYRAFVTAMPGADVKRYALLVFLWPTLLFWPSSAGKDCWMLFSLGVAALGAARVLVRRPGGYSLLLLGLFLGSVVRPHIVLIELIGFAFAFLIGRRAAVVPGRMTPGSVTKAAGLILLLVVGGLLLNRTTDLLASNDINGIDAALTTNVSRTVQGGSQFTPASPTRPIGYVTDAVTILFRPFPFEAHSAEQLGTAAEGLFLMGLVVASRRRLRTIPLRLRNQPYVTMALIFLAMFVFALGTIGNFGILARERSQLVPFVFVLLCVPAGAPREKPTEKRPSWPVARPRTTR